MINVTKAYLPPIDEYKALLDGIWDRAWLTNNGPLVKELEQKLKEYLGVKYLIFVNNGTVALQIAIKALELKGEVITTPFSYCATTTSLIWENCKPVFVDILPETTNIDPDLIEKAITPNTTAIMATHVYGLPCEVEKIEAIAQKHNLKVIYDAAHTFGVEYKGKSLLSYGDIATCSFHATKVFHTIEGGCIVCQDEELYKKMFLYRSFGHNNDDYFSIGINGKNSEFHAAMGLCNLPKVQEIIARRKAIFAEYDRLLNWEKLKKPNIYLESLVYNYAYYPVIFESEQAFLKVREALNAVDIFPRRYFYPSLNQLPYVTEYDPCPISEDISVKVASLPLYFDLAFEDVGRICQIINDNLKP